MGDVLPMQIIERRKLPPGDALWLGSLGGDLSAEAIKAVLEEAGKVPRGAPIGAYLYMVLMANTRKTREVLKMSDIATIDEIFEGLGIIEYYEAKGEKKKAVEVARNLKKIGLSSEQQINGL
jgi:hypothetical protein